MTVTVLERAVSRRFVEPSYVRMMLDITDSSMSNTKLETMIDDICAYIESYCDRRNEMFAERVSETFRPQNISDALYPSRYPLISVESITENTTGLDTGYYEISYGDDHEPARIFRLDGAGNKVRWGWPVPGISGFYGPSYLVTVVYRAGYYADDDTGGNVPHDLRLATLKAFDRMRLTLGRDLSVRSEEVPGVFRATYGSATGDTGSSVASDSPEGLLLPYRRGPAIG